jgi:hypothetical protein
MKYDIFVHGVGVTVHNKRTNQIGVVKLIKETAPEWIEPFVDYGDGELTRALTFELEVIDVHESPKTRE